MTYTMVVSRGWFCSCKSRPPQLADHDTWGEWKLCNICRLPIKESNQAGQAEHKLK